VFGVATFVFLGIAGRDLGPADFGPVSVAYTAVNGVGIGLFIPAEQEVSRLMAARRANGQPAPLLRHVLVYLGVACLAIALVTVVAGSWLATTFLGGERELVWVTAAALAALGVEYLVRGTLSGSGRFVRYGLQLGIDGIARAGLAAAIALLGWGSVVSYGMVMVIAPLVASVLTLSASSIRWLRTQPTATGPTPIALLVATTVTSQLLGNAGPLAIAVLAGITERTSTGAFVSAITVGRVPLFLFAAVQAAFLPTLAGLVARHAVADLKRTLRLALTATIGVGLAGIAGIALLGEWALHLVYGPDFHIAWGDFVLIAASGALFMLALATGQALLAHHRDGWVVIGWVSGLATTVASLWLPLSLTTRVATSLTIGSGVSAAILSYCLQVAVRRWAGGTA
jgi:O-antigen/teichoic acid export membrane protein